MALLVSSSGWHPWPVAMSSWPRSRVCWIEGLVKKIDQRWNMIRFYQFPFVMIWNQPAKEKDTFYQWDVSVFFKPRFVLGGDVYFECLFFKADFGWRDFLHRFRKVWKITQWIPCESHVIHRSAQENQVRWDFSVPRLSAFGVGQRKKTNRNGVHLEWLKDVKMTITWTPWLLMTFDDVSFSCVLVLFWDETS